MATDIAIKNQKQHNSFSLDIPATTIKPSTLSLLESTPLNVETTVQSPSVKSGLFQAKEYFNLENELSEEVENSEINENGHEDSHEYEHDGDSYEINLEA